MSMYWKYAGGGTEFAVVPDDFRMVAGNITRDHLDMTQASHTAISFQCVGDGFNGKLEPILAEQGPGFSER